MPEVHIIGTIHSGVDFDVPAAYCRWRLEAGAAHHQQSSGGSSSATTSSSSNSSSVSDPSKALSGDGSTAAPASAIDADGAGSGSSGWVLLGGASSGHTQTTNTITDGLDTMEWSHPIDAYYACTSVVGWPLLYVSVWERDSVGRNEIAGYGCVRVPSVPGTHLLEVMTWRPQGTVLQEVAAWFRGGYPQLTDSSLVTAPERGRHFLGTTTAGSVVVEVSVTQKGFEELGVYTSSSSSSSSVSSC